ncbi:HD domain-containing protein [Rhodococcus sp. SJ-2]
MDSSTWTRTLAEQADDPHTDARAQLRHGYEQFRRRVEPLASEISLSVPGYTDHSILHCDSLWDITDVVAGVEYPLTPAEAFVLGGSFLIHDLGMGLAAHEQGIAGILEDEEWIDLLASLYPNNFEALQAQARRDIRNNPNWDGLTSQEIKHALTVFLRDHHAEQAERIVTQQWSLSSEETFYLLEDSELRHWYGQLIGRLGRSHWQDVESLPDAFSLPIGAPPKLPPEWTVDPLKVAGILRCADAAQVDARRADPLHTPFRRPQGESRHHWLFQERMLYPQLQGDRLAYTSSTRFAADQVTAWWLAFDTIQMIDGELAKVDALFADLNRPRLAAKSVAGAHAPTRFAKYVPTDNWMPIDARPTISDTQAVIRNLGGSALYGMNRADVVIRELLANAVDATRLKRLAYSDEYFPPIRVFLDKDERGDTVEIRDFGIGMTSDEMVAYLCDFGRSGWRGQLTRQNHPGALAAGFKSTGQFGIGFYSAFMISDDVMVTTRAANLGPNDTMVLHFTNGLQSRPIMRAAERKERLMQPGTKVTLRLHENWDAQDSDGVRRRYLRPADMADGIQHLALMCDESIELVTPDGFHRLCVDGHSWSEMSANELFDHLVGVASAPSGAAIAKEKELFISRVRPLYGADGSVQGRLCLDLGSEFRVLGHYLQDVPGGIYCGGFYSGEIIDVVGVLAGEPTTAARDLAFPAVEDEEICRWFREQVELLSGEDLRELDKLKLAAWSISIGERLDEFPFVVGRDELLSPEQYVRWVGDRSEFVVLDTVNDPIDIGDGRRVYLHRPSHSLHEIPEGVLADPGYTEFGMSYFVYDMDGWMLNDLPTPKPMPYGDTATWWYHNYGNVQGEIVRLAAEAWDSSVEEILLLAEWSSRDENGSGGFEIDTIDGRKIRRSGVTFRRPS